MLSACSASAPAGPSAAMSVGTVSGALAAVGGPAPGSTHVLSGSVRITNTRSHSSHVLSVRADGRYAVAVLPGTYLVVGKSPSFNGGTAFNCAALRPVVVIAGRTTTASVYCEER